jgi:hypothetical protein
LKESAEEYKDVMSKYNKMQESLVKEVVKIAGTCLIRRIAMYLKFRSDVLACVGGMESHPRSPGCGLEVHFILRLFVVDQLTSLSFADVAVNAPEPYVKPTVLEKGLIPYFCIIPS